MTSQTMIRECIYMKANLPRAIENFRNIAYSTHLIAIPPIIASKC